MPSQYQQALQSILNRNTQNFNTKYAFTNQGRNRTFKRVPSQFKVALEAIRSRSPKSFNEQFPNSPTPLAIGGSTPRKSQTKKIRRGALTTKNANKIRVFFQKPPLHPGTQKRINPMFKPRKVYYNLNEMNKVGNMSVAEINAVLRSLSKSK